MANTSAGTTEPANRTPRQLLKDAQRLNKKGGGVADDMLAFAEWIRDSIRLHTQLFEALLGQQGAATNPGRAPKEESASREPAAALTE